MKYIDLQNVYHVDINATFYVHSQCAQRRHKRQTQIEICNNNRERCEMRANERATHRYYRTCFYIPICVLPTATTVREARQEKRRSCGCCLFSISRHCEIVCTSLKMMNERQNEEKETRIENSATKNSRRHTRIMRTFHFAFVDHTQNNNNIYFGWKRMRC